MFKYDERIFNEIHEVDFDPMANEYFMETVYPQIAEKEDDDPILSGQLMSTTPD